MIPFGPTLNELVNRWIKQRDCEHVWKFEGYNMYSNTAEKEYCCIKCNKKKRVTIDL